MKSKKVQKLIQSKAVVQTKKELMGEEKTQTKISQPVSSSMLLKFALPTILSMILTSTFGIVDGLFVSNLIGPLALSVVGLIFPFLTFAMSVGFMLGVGGNALIAKQIGEGNVKWARENFNLIIVVSLAVSIILSSVGIIFTDQLLLFLGADYSMLEMARVYLIPIGFFMPLIILSVIFQQFLMTEGKAHISTFSFLAGGIVSALLNVLLIYIMQWGLMGAALATGIGYTIPALIGAFYFTFKRTGNLYFGKTSWRGSVIVRAAINGASEMVTMLAVSITSILMHNIAMRLAGPEAIAAISIMFAAMNIMASLFIGYASGIIPIISYNYGANNDDNLKKLYSNSLKILSVLSLLSTVVMWIVLDPFIRFYIDPVYDINIYQMSSLGIRILSSSFILMAINTFASMFFTGLNNGKISSLLSFFRSLVFVVTTLLILPNIFGITGLWLAMPVAEILGIGLTIYFFNKLKSSYRYA